MLLLEHAENVKQHLKRTEKALHHLHAALQNMLEEHGAAAGLALDEIQALGGGTDKTPPPE